MVGFEPVRRDKCHSARRSNHSATEQLEIRFYRLLFTDHWRSGVESCRLIYILVTAELNPRRHLYGLPGLEGQHIELRVAKKPQSIWYNSKTETEYERLLLMPESRKILPKTDIKYGNSFWRLPWRLVNSILLLDLISPTQKKKKTHAPPPPL